MYIQFVYLCMIYSLHIQISSIFNSFFRWIDLFVYMRFVYHIFFMVIFSSKYGLFCICVLYINP